MRDTRRYTSTICSRAAIALMAVVFVVSFAFAASAQDEPIIIIPGLTGSELINEKTGEHVWFKAPRSKDDDLTLPISPDLAKNRDSLVPGDILRSIKFGPFPRIDVYGGLVDELKAEGGYHDESWTDPTAKGSSKAIYTFSYDWRLDNVSNARLLIKKITALKAKLKAPDLKFNIIAHSMGGIIARYAAMYGDADLPAIGHKPVPTWAGAKHLKHIVMLGTPNEGSAGALSTMVNGYAIGGLHVNLPWVQNISKFDVFSIPTSYQLLPAPGTLHVVDEHFEPLNIDIYDPASWARYGWNPIDDPKFDKEFSPAEVRGARKFFAENLARAKRLHEALSAVSKTRVEFDLVGSDCKDTLDTIVVYKDAKTGTDRTLFKPSPFTRSNGEKVTDVDLKAVMMMPGDGIVTRRSFELETLTKLSNGNSLLGSPVLKTFCEDHNKLAANADIQKYLIALFTTGPAAAKM